MKFLNQNNFISPNPIENINGEILNNFKTKQYIIVNFLEGKPRVKISSNDCYLVEDLNEYTKKIVIKKCKYLVSEWK